MISKLLLTAFFVTALTMPGFAAGKNQSKPVASDFNKPLVMDSAVKSGKLKNGMTYFIKQNSEPKNRIFLRLVVKAGSVMETETELGVAHFIEHLAFNGTENFEKNDIIHYFEKIGMDFGDGLNAYTSFEETVYTLEIPADDPEILKTSMLILHDWAGAITFPEEEIEKERGVINEEWRLRSLGLQGRTTNAIIPFMMKDSVFEKRLPIGNMDVINTITRDEIVSFYKKWYHPEIMSVVVVGDADVNTLEGVVKDVMGTLPKSKKKISVKANRLNEPKDKDVLIFTDPEQKYPVINIFEYVKDPVVSKTEKEVRKSYIADIASYIFNLRAREITVTPESPWLDAAISESSYNNMDRYYFMGVVPKEGMFEEALGQLFDEVDRFATFGVTQTELDRVIGSIRASNEQKLATKDQLHSSGFASELVSHVTIGYVPRDVESNCNLVEKILSSITVDDVNEMARSVFKDRGSKFLLIAPENYPGLLSEEQFKEIWINHKNESVEAYVDDSVTELYARPATKGKIVSESENKVLGTKEYVLSNGIRIITRKTDFKKDEIHMQASSKGGEFYISDKDIPSVSGSLQYMYQSGVNGLSFTQLSKFLQDKYVGFDMNITNTAEYLTANSNRKDMEYLFQLVSAFMTKRQYSEDAWKALMEQYTVSAKAHGSTPNDAFNDKINEILYGNDIRYAPFDMKYLEKMNAKTAEKIVEDRFSNPADFTFVFVGDFDEEELMDMACVYFGSFETTDKREETVYKYWDFPKKKIVETVKKGQDEQGSVYMLFGGELAPEENMEQNFKESFIIEQLSSLMEMKLRENIREDKSGSYGIGTSAWINGWPERFYRAKVTFGCEPSREEELSGEVLKTLEEIKKGIDEDSINKLREQYRRSHEKNLRENWYWIDTINAVNIFTYKPDWVVNDVETVVSWITAENLQDAAKKYLDTEKYVCVYLKPEK